MGFFSRGWLLASLLSLASLRADIVVLKNGTTYANVRAFPAGGVHRIMFQNGQAVVVPNAQIAKVRIAPVYWPPPKPVEKPPEKVEKPVEKPATLALGPVLKSTILPGWGQASLGHYGRGAFFLGITGATAAQYWTYRGLHAEAQAAYSEQATPAFLSLQGNQGYLMFAGILQQEKKVLLQREYQTNTMAAILGILWGWNIVDTFVLANPGVARKYPFLEYFRIGMDTPTASREPGRIAAGVALDF